jgi:UDP-glucose 4-epimerase
MRVLVTGGAGFIGSHLVERLLARGDAALVLDDLSSGTLENLAAVQGHPALEVHVGSALDEPRVAALVARADAVVHLAAAVGVQRVVDQTAQTLETNLGCTRTVLGAAARARTRVLLASSSEVYGPSPRVPAREDDPVSLGATSVARWSYACAKALDEWLGLAVHREQRVPVTIARLFNTVGPRQTGAFGMVLPRFVHSAVRGEPLVVHGDGQQTRCFAHVADVAEALLRLLGCAQAAGAVVNVGATEEVPVADLAARVCAEAGSGSRVVFAPYAEVFGEGFEDPRRRVPDVSRLRALTGFVPGTPLQTIVRDALGWERHRLSSPAVRAAGG